MTDGATINLLIGCSFVGVADSLCRRAEPKRATLCSSDFSRGLRNDQVGRECAPSTTLSECLSCPLEESELTRFS